VDMDSFLLLTPFPSLLHWASTFPSAKLTTWRLAVTCLGDPNLVHWALSVVPVIRLICWKALVFYLSSLNQILLM
jgi:hypothetical protein